MTYTDIMIDIETLDTKHTARILEIGWCLFDITRPHDGQEVAHDSVLVSITDEKNKARTQSKDTVEWWEKQDPKLYERALSGTIRLEDALDVLCEETIPVMYDRQAQVVQRSLNWRNIRRVWANSPTFDLAILRDAMDSVGIECPWKFYQERDYRTLRDVVSLRHPSIDLPYSPMNAHSAQDDALAQAKNACVLFEKLSRAF